MNTAMLRFKRDLLKWTRHILKQAYLDTLEVEDLPDNCAFVLVARWKNGGVLRQRYDLEYVMGPRAASPPLQQAPRMRTCRFRDDFIRSVLNARGV